MLSQGPFTYNRFDVLNEKAKPDFLDVDKDKNKKESFKKAVKDKEGKCDKCGKKDCGCDDKKDKKDDKKLPPWLKKEEVETVYPMDEGNCGGYQKGGVVKPAKGAPKATVVKEDVLQYMLENNYVNNEVSAEVLFNHISDEFLEDIEEKIMEGFKPFPKEKVDRQIGKKHDQEQAAVRAGDQAKANKLMHQRGAMNSPMGRKWALQDKKKKGY